MPITVVAFTPLTTIPHNTSIVPTEATANNSSDIVSVKERDTDLGRGGADVWMLQRDIQETADDRSMEQSMEQNEIIQFIPGTAVDTDGRPSPYFRLKRCLTSRLFLLHSMYRPHTSPGQANVLPGSKGAGMGGTPA